VIEVSEELICEKLAPDEALIITRIGDSLIYAANKNGELVINKAEFPKE